ncbi:MAG: rod shape-determining protein MreC, partial [Nitrospirae bacterium CG_4_9_14_3_um_filter_53_35]
VLSASPNYSLVQLLIDSNSAVPALVQRTRAQGIVEGKIADLCRIKYLDRLADIRKGDLVLSSGLGGVYPKGLVIGTVTSVQKKPYGLFQEVLVSPAVEFSRLEEAFVVKESRRPGDDQPFKSVQE